MNTFFIKNATRKDRHQQVKDALAISLLDASEPSLEAIHLAQEYVDGKIDIDEVLNIIIEIYKPQS